MTYRLFEKDWFKLKSMLPEDYRDVIAEVDNVVGEGYKSYNLKFPNSSKNIPGDVLKRVYEFAFKNNYWVWGVRYIDKEGIIIALGEMIK
jgi:hypothetical protein